ncbi:MAG: FecR domain-containing protein [Dehalococcoidales bacterium]|nr:FecR domain-containing protein [Dehalococcoidales bacterium]
MKDINKILDNCIERILRGEDLDRVLSEYPEVREQLEPLLRMALQITVTPKVKPSPEFLNTSKTSLLRQIYCESSAHIKAGTETNAFSQFISGITGSIAGFFAPKGRIPIAVSLILVAVLVITVGQFTFFKPSTAYASQCFLRILSGEVNVMKEGSDSYITGVDGMSLTVGAKIKTEDESHALLAFFDGSTIKLDPGTVLEILEMSGQESDTPSITLNQLIGRTWSRVEKMLDSESAYKIETPSATAVVRGTLFTTEVNASGTTSVTTTLGLVSVLGEEVEVYVPANKKTEVIQGSKPSTPSEPSPPLTKMVIVIQGPATASVNDPTGSSTGVFTDGSEFNQIPGSVCSTLPDGTQTITINEPVEGNYNLALRFLDAGTASYHIYGMSGDEIVFDYPGLLDTEEQSGSLINFNLKSSGNDLNIDTVKVKNLGDTVLEKTVSPDEFVKPSDARDKSEDKGKTSDKDEKSSGKDQEKYTIPDKNKQEKSSGNEKNEGPETGNKKDVTPPGKDKSDDTGTTNEDASTSGKGNSEKNKSDIAKESSVEKGNSNKDKDDSSTGTGDNSGDDASTGEDKSKDKDNNGKNDKSGKDDSSTDIGDNSGDDASTGEDKSKDKDNNGKNDKSGKDDSSTGIGDDSGDDTTGDSGDDSSTDTGDDSGDEPSSGDDESKDNNGKNDKSDKDDDKSDKKNKKDTDTSDNTTGADITGGLITFC